MRFSCGYTAEEQHRMLEEWHDFFPLWPRKIGEANGRDVCVWLETIQRKGFYWSGWDDYAWIWEYRAKP